MTGGAFISVGNNQLKTARFYLLRQVALFTLVLTVFSPQKVQADLLEIAVPEIRVYGAPDQESDVITTLFKGDQVTVSLKSPEGFKKVLIQDGEKKRVGYISNADLKGALGSRGKKDQAKAKPKKKVKRHVLQDHVVLGVTAGVNYQYQGSRPYTDAATDASATLSATSGSSSLYGVFGEFSLTHTLSLQGYVEMKSVSVTGTAAYNFTVIPGAAIDIFLKENYLSVGGLLKIYNQPTSQWWYGPGIQYDKRLSGTLKFGGFPEQAVTTSLAFTNIYAAIGAYFPIVGDIYLMPDFRAGALFVSSPLIMEVDLRVQLGYAF